ncbi:MAG: NUDIX domain-containing protein [Fervidobacterium sp.]
MYNERLKENLKKLVKKYFSKDYIKNIDSFKDTPHCLVDAKVYSIIIPFIIVNDDIYILLEKRSAFVKQPFELSFPGGQKEEHEDSSLISALRECEEEIGLARQSFSKIKFCGFFANLKTVIYVFSAMVKPEICRKIEKQLKFNSNEKSKVIFQNENEVEKIILFPFEILTFPPKEFNIEYKGHINNLPDNINFKNIIIKNYLNEGFYLPYIRKISYWEYEDEILWGYSADIIHMVTKQIINS